LKWIHKENDHLESLTDEKLSVYAEILKEQIQELQNQKEGILFQPQYAVLMEEFGWEIKRNPLDTLHQELILMQRLAANFKESITDFKSELALRYIKQMIKAWKLQKAEEEEDNHLWSLFL
jgi:hypothetical protein